jgi:hypothetical protein
MVLEMVNQLPLREAEARVGREELPNVRYAAPVEVHLLHRICTHPPAAIKIQEQARLQTIRSPPWRRR